MPVENTSFDLSEEYRQLALGLDLPEVEMDGISPEAARLRSEEARKKFEQENASEEYRMLRDEGWPWRQATYIAWMATPKPRKPETQEQLAKEVLGLSSDRAINTWIKKNPMIVERIASLQSSSFFDWRANHIHALNVGASKGGEDYKFFNHLKLALEIDGIYIPTNKLTAEFTKRIGTGDLSGMTDQQLAELAKSVISEMKGKDAGE